MWYFAWILGTLLACSFGVITALALAHVRLLAVKIEIDVISHIHRARFINLSLIHI